MHTSKIYMYYAVFHSIIYAPFYCSLLFTKTILTVVYYNYQHNNYFMYNIIIYRLSSNMLKDGTEQLSTCECIKTEHP